MWKKRKSLAALKIKLKQKKIKELIDSMLLANVEVRSAPISREYFLIDKENRVNILISESSVKICNHDYLYEVSVSANEAAVFIKKIQNKIQQQSEELKKELFKNEVNLIDKIKSIYN